MIGTVDLDQLIARYAGSDQGEHPAWCARELLCDGRHTSSEHAIPASGGQTVYVVSVLDQGSQLVELLVVAGGNEIATITIGPGGARQLADALTEAVARHQTIAPQ